MSDYWVCDWCMAHIPNSQEICNCRAETDVDLRIAALEQRIRELENALREAHQRASLAGPAQVGPAPAALLCRMNGCLVWQSDECSHDRED